jgi:hypothetical protein
LSRVSRSRDSLPPSLISRGCPSVVEISVGCLVVVVCCPQVTTYTSRGHPSLSQRLRRDIIPTDRNHVQVQFRGGTSPTSLLLPSPPHRSAVLANVSSCPQEEEEEEERVNLPGTATQDTNATIRTPLLPSTSAGSLSQSQSQSKASAEEQKCHHLSLDELVRREPDHLA